MGFVVTTSGEVVAGNATPLICRKTVASRCLLAFGGSNLERQAPHYARLTFIVLHTQRLVVGS